MTAKMSIFEVLIDDRDWARAAQMITLETMAERFLDMRPIELAISGHAPMWLLEQMLPLVDLEAQDYMGKTALHKAIESTNIQGVELLLQWGADPNDPLRDPPIFTAIRVSGNASVRLLLDAGAHVNIPNQIGHTPLFVAFQQRSSLDVKRMLMMADGVMYRESLQLARLHTRRDIAMLIA